MSPLQRISALVVGALLSLVGNPVQAQWFGFGRPANCGCEPYAAQAPMVHAMTSAAAQPQTICHQVQPVMQTMYHTVPVTEYQQVKQTVKRPVVETNYVDQQVTEYKPVTETRVVNVPTVSYQDVTEHQQVTRNVGFWNTRYVPNMKMSPCEADPRPGFTGWWNRQSVEMKNAFTPDYSVQREYCPQQITQVVPVTRRVAVQGTRQVSYNVTTMVPQTTTKKVAMNTVKYVDHEVTAMQPVTVMRSVPIGTRMAYAPIGGPAAGGTATATLTPTPDPVSNRAAAPSNNRQADDSERFDRRRGANRDDGTFRGSSLPPNLTTPAAASIQPVGELKLVALDDNPPAAIPEVKQAAKAKSDTPATKIPTAARVGQWVAHVPRDKEQLSKDTPAKPAATPTKPAVKGPILAGYKPNAE